ncbi:MAG TPA: hypothetical protein P5534_12565 [Candidatus Paceibacterota bacterium]|nr:hypothetical protein [Candidatus Paceibacterota bacterium]
MNEGISDLGVAICDWAARGRQSRSGNHGDEIAGFLLQGLGGLLGQQRRTEPGKENL